jgi:bacterioferritin-associated ferredoxin
MLIVLICFNYQQWPGRQRQAPRRSTGVWLKFREPNRTMVVCNCFNVRERDLAELANEGRCCLKSVRQATGLGTNCGKCIPQARAVISAQKPALLTTVSFGPALEVRA